MSQKVVIVGSGVFGMSTALWMLEDRRGKYDVTILEKCQTVPAPDAASTDINKIVRGGDYEDPALAKLSVDAVKFWKRPEWEGTYHESGVICLAGTDSAGRAYVDGSLANCVNMNLNPTRLTAPEDIKKQFPRGLETGAFVGRTGYINKHGGWAEAARAIEVGHKRILAAGGHIRGGCEVVSFEKKGRKVTGVVLKSGEVVPADLVIVAAGAWTPSLLASRSINSYMPPVVATGQVVAMIQLTPDEYKIQTQAPVVFNLDDGYYIFPPTKDGIVKMAIHSAGYTNHLAPGADGSMVSVPRTKLTPGAENGAIPVQAVKKIRQGLIEHFPELGKKPFVDTRLCWYCDTVTGDWLVDYHPDYENLVLATGGSGHAFKFAPNIGREILAIVERDPNSIFRDRFSFSPSAPSGADVRNGVRKEIVVSELATPTDLLPVPQRAAARL